MAETDNAAELPLAGLRVVEFCHVVMGPSCGLVLAELGADVVKVEPAPGGDRTRALKGHVAGAFTYFNRSKKSIGINLKSPEGLDLAHRLLRDADIMTENFAPGTADRLGIGYQAMSRLNPRLIYCSLKGYLSGPRENQTALDEVVQFNAGLAYMTGPPGRPLRAGSSVTDITGGVFGVVGILAALHRRHATGKGELIRSGLYESCAFLVGQHMAAEAHTGKPPDPLPIRPRSWAIYDLFETADQKSVFVAMTSDKQWVALCQKLGRRDLQEDERFSTNEKRRAEHAFVYSTLSEQFRQYPAAELIEMLSALGLSAAQMRRPGELFDDAQLNHENRMREARFPSGNQARLPGLPITIGEIKTRASGQAPEFGEHTREILQQFGVSDTEIGDLAARGVVT